MKRILGEDLRKKTDTPNDFGSPTGMRVHWLSVSVDVLVASHAPSQAR
jgi:hypothetical protein